MLRSFRFENHLSFRDETEFSLEPAFGKDKSLLTVAAIYGANAAGKSNLLEALDFMARAVLDSYQRWAPDSGVPRRPFRLDPALTSAPSTYVAELLLDGIRHVYGFVIDDQIVREEWLYSYPKARRRILFEREGPEVKLGTSLGEDQRRSEALADLTRDNALFLSIAAQAGMGEFLSVWHWFSRMTCVGRGPNSPRLDQRELVGLLGGPDGDRFRELIRLADLGIADVLSDLGQPLEPESMERLLATINRLRLQSPGPSAAVPSEQILRAVRTTTMVDTGERLLFDHGDSSALFSLDEESTGTRSWISMLPTVMSALDSGATLLVDEIDASLHPHLSAELIKLFQSRRSNPGLAQLIFTTHDATLLGTSFGEELLTRDQIWFTEKDGRGASRLYPLTDFHPRKGENREKRYLGGSYGAVPVINNSTTTDHAEPHAS